MWCVAVDCSYGASKSGNVELNRACSHRAGHKTQRDSAIAWLVMTLWFNSYWSYVASV